MVNGPIGFRDTTTDPIRDDLRNRMLASPEGRQLSTDGSLLAAIVDFDPATAMNTAPDGRIVIYIRAGTKELWAFDRANGWQQL